MAKTMHVNVPCRIKAIGVGGGGCNALNRMVQAGIKGIEFIAANTDVQALMLNEASTRIQLGEKATGGLGSGGDPAKGRRAAEESREELREVLSGAHMVFIAAGMGGGTGTGACPIIAEIAKESGALTIGIVTRPFGFEGVRRAQVANDGISQLMAKVNSVIIIPNERLLSIVDERATVDNAFKLADDVLMTGVRAISEVIISPGLINLDFADVKSIMCDAGPAWLSIGHSAGRERTVEAARSAIASPLLESSIDGAKGVLYVVTGASNLTLSEVSQAAEVIKKAVDPEANVIFGVTLDSSMDSDVRITLIATGFTSPKTVEAQRKDEEFRRVIKGLDESSLGKPAFMRRPLSMRQRVS
jgi:cell division protein FtsZ